jgi:DNA-binding response OmpR family regulator
VKILLVEDNEDLAQSMRLLLSLQGYEVRSYPRSRALLEEADRIGENDVLVTDYYLPDLNGVELVKQLRSRLPKLRAMLLTGSREEGIVKAAGALAGCGILHKPLDCDELLSYIRGMEPPS